MLNRIFVHNTALGFRIRIGDSRQITDSCKDVGIVKLQMMLLCGTLKIFYYLFKVPIFDLLNIKFHSFYSYYKVAYEVCSVEWKTFFKYYMR